MVVKATQIQSIRTQLETQFVHRLMRHFAQLWPDKVCAMGTGYQAWMESAIRSAEGYGLNTEQSIARYANLWFVWGRAFESQSGFDWALEILLDSRRTAHVKAHQLVYRTTVELENRRAWQGERRASA